MVNDKTTVNTAIRVLSEADIDSFWPVRLRALKEEPESFLSSYEESIKMSPIEISKYLHCSDNSFVLGAFGPNLAGIVGFFRQQGTQVQHKGVIWGVYVIPESRGKGLGKALMQAAISRARTIPKLEQLILTVETTNQSARQLYLSVRFISYGTEPRALKVRDKYLDDDLMMLKL